jgi:hypothetical protein
VFQAMVLPGMGYWLDELYSHRAGDPSVPFAEAFMTRILPDTNGPIRHARLGDDRGCRSAGRRADPCLCA